MNFTPLCLQSAVLDSKLTPEQTRALNVLLEAWPPNAIKEEDLTVSDITVTGSLIYTRKSVRRVDLPHENHWLWNQSKAQSTAIFNEASLKIIWYKINPRKKPQSNDRYPAFKVWVFKIFHSTSDDELHCLWCERGKDTPESIPPLVPISTAIGRIQPEKLTGEELSFLKPLMDPATAKEFGW